MAWPGGNRGIGDVISGCDEAYHGHGEGAARRDRQPPPPGVEALSIVAPEEQTEVHAGIAPARRSNFGAIVSWLDEAESERPSRRYRVHAQVNVWQNRGMNL